MIMTCSSGISVLQIQRPAIPAEGQQNNRNNKLTLRSVSNKSMSDLLVFGMLQSLIYNQLDMIRFAAQSACKAVFIQDPV